MGGSRCECEYSGTLVGKASKKTRFSQNDLPRRCRRMHPSPALQSGRGGSLRRKNCTWMRRGWGEPCAWRSPRAPCCSKTPRPRGRLCIPLQRDFLMRAVGGTRRSRALCLRVDAWRSRADETHARVPVPGKRTKLLTSSGTRETDETHTRVPLPNCGEDGFSFAPVCRRRRFR